MIRHLLLQLLGLDPGRDWRALEEACAEQAAKTIRRAAGWSPCSLERHRRDESGRYILMVWQDGSRWTSDKGWQKPGKEGLWS
jgi:hypothetical protein